MLGRSSLGAQAAMAKAGGIAAGLFSWAAWPWAFRDIDTYTDASYKQFLGGKPYMMPVSPWFYTNMPGYNKNWLWRGDSIWAARWLQIEWWQPEFVQIISWNDYGESHHIGPIRDKAMVAFETGQAPFNYVVQHDGWRAFLPFVIDRYKTGSATIQHEGIVAWWRPNPNNVCSDGGTSANTASQLQLEFQPNNILEDAVFFSALLQGREDKVDVYVGDEPSPAGFFMSPEGGAGLFHGSVALNGRRGPVRIDIWRGGKVVANLVGKMDITDKCSAGGLANYNAYVQHQWSTPSISVTPPPVQDLVCVNGTGVGDFELLCMWTCSSGYCPDTACVCTKMGKQPKPRPEVNVVGYPAEGRDSSFAGLCAVACRQGQCERFKEMGVCDDKPHPYVIPEVSPFLPHACNGGSGPEYRELCEFTCEHGYCPLSVCVCTHIGNLKLLEPTGVSNATTYAQDDLGLCAFACSRNYCPSMCHTVIDPEADGYGPGYDPLTDTYIEGQNFPEEWACKASAVRDSLDSLEAAIDQGSIPLNCRARFALRALISELDGFEDEFNEAAKNYDSLFGYYEDFVKKQIDPQLTGFMAWSGKGNKYFTCTFSENKVQKTQPCPPPESMWKNKELGFTVTYNLVDPDGFYKALSSELGIEKDWIKFGENKDLKYCMPSGYEPYFSHRNQTNRRSSKSPPPTITSNINSTDLVPRKPNPCIFFYHTRRNFPTYNGEAVHPGNPKAMIEAAMPNITALSDTLLQQYFTAATGGSGGDPADVVTAAAMPVLMLQSAVESMRQIKEIAQQEKDLQEKSLILLILSIVLMVVPFVGEAVGAAFGGVAMISRVALLIGEAGNAALTVYDIVEDPLSAPFAILGMVVAPFSARQKSSRVVFKEAAELRKGLKEVDLKKFGDSFKTKDARIQKILGRTCSR